MADDFVLEDMQDSWCEYANERIRKTIKGKAKAVINGKKAIEGVDDITVAGSGGSYEVRLSVEGRTVAIVPFTSEEDAAWIHCESNSFSVDIRPKGEHHEH